MFGTENDLGLYYEGFKCFCLIPSLSVWAVQKHSDISKEFVMNWTQF
jgi:hypothetical protein